MTRTELLARISINPNICFGKPCIKGHRIWVSLVLDLLASGWSTDQVIEEYPGLERDDVLACIAYGAEMSANATSRWRRHRTSEAVTGQEHRLSARLTCGCDCGTGVITCLALRS